MAQYIRAAPACRPCRGRFFVRINLSDICSHPGNKACADALSIIAITQPKDQPHHETTFIDRICSLHFCACSNSVRVGNADCPPECTYGRWQPNHPSPWLGPSRWRSWLGSSRWPSSSLWLGPRSSLRMGSSSWLGPSSLGLVVIILKEAASAWRLFHLSHYHDDHTQKPPRLPSRACAVALRLRRGLPGRAVLERSPSLLAKGAQP